jgi:hypothetical protein
MSGRGVVLLGAALAAGAREQARIVTSTGFVTGIGLMIGGGIDVWYAPMGATP